MSALIGDERPSDILGYLTVGGGQGHGSMSGLPRAQFALLPNTCHWNILMRTDMPLPTSHFWMQLRRSV